MEPLTYTNKLTLYVHKQNQLYVVSNDLNGLNTIKTFKALSMAKLYASYWSKQDVDFII